LLRLRLSLRLGGTLAIAKRNEQCSDVLAMASRPAPRLTRTLRLNRVVGAELSADVDRLVCANQHATRSTVCIGLKIAYGISPRVNTPPQERVSTDQTLDRAIRKPADVLRERE
jgi:hypothetical protein